MESASTGRRTPEMTGSTCRSETPLAPVDDLLDYVKEYARVHPEVAALTCLGIGFILGWKLKPW